MVCGAWSEVIQVLLMLVESKAEGIVRDMSLGTVSLWSLF